MPLQNSDHITLSAITLHDLQSPTHGFVIEAGRRLAEVEKFARESEPSCHSR